MTHNKFDFRHYIKTAIYISVLFMYIVTIVYYWDAISKSLINYPMALLYALGLSIIAIAIQAYNFTDLLGSEVKIQFLSTYRMWAMSNIINYIAPFQPGLVARGIYFKSHSISYSKTLHTTLRQLLLSLWVGIGILALFLPYQSMLTYYLKLSAAGIFLFFLFIIFYDNSELIKKYLPHRYLSNVRTLFARPSIAQIIFIMIQYVLIALCYYLVLSEFRLTVSMPSVFLLAVAIILSTIISITPNNIGLQELIIGSAVYKMGAIDAHIISIPIIFRTAHILACGVILLLPSIISLKKKAS